MAHEPAHALHLTASDNPGPGESDGGVGAREDKLGPGVMQTAAP